MNRIGLPLFFLILSGCAHYPVSEADWTTYPREKVVEVTQRVSVIPNAKLPASVGNIEYKTNVRGDSAIEEGFVLPRSRAEIPESALFERVAENGRKQCQGDFRVVESHYYYGDEATLKFLRINSPALRVVFRCALKLELENEKQSVHTLEEISSYFPDYRFFDISMKRYEMSSEALFDVVRRSATESGMPIVHEGQSGNLQFLIAGRDENEKRKGKLEKLVAVVSGDETGSELTFRLFAYQLTYHKRGVFDEHGPPEDRGAQPWDRDVAYERAMQFLFTVDQRAKTRN